MRAALVPLLALLAIAPAFAALGAQSLPANVRVTNVLGPANEVSIAVNPLDGQQLLIGAKDYSLGNDPACGVHSVWAGVYRSSDGGATWQEGRIPGFPGDAPGVLTGYPCSSDPVVAFDGFGRAHYNGLAYNGDQPFSLSTVYVATSLDGGATWPVIDRVLDLPDRFAFNDKEWFAFDPVTGTATEVWDVLGPGGGVTAATCPAGLACVVAQTDLGGLFPTVAVGPDSVVHVATFDFDHVNYLSAAHGVPFGAGRDVAGLQEIGGQPNSGYRVLTDPTVAVDPGDGQRVYIVWPDARRDVSDIYGIASSDGGATWTPPFRINDDAAGHSNFMPAIGVAPNGRVDVSFLDRRDDPGNRYNVEYVASSYDHGATWVNTRVGEVGFDGTGCFHQEGPKFIGDYQGVASTNSAAHPVWADSRNGRCDVYTASLPR
jgi:hypothetical protein